jgi:hypothetical protein
MQTIRMANPQTEDGFVMVALDLFPAILSAGLSGYAQIVLAEVLLQCYGPQKKDRVTLVPSELGIRTGLDRNNARRAIRELVEAGILRGDRDTYRFNKDYDSWSPKAGPIDGRLNGAMTKWIKGAIELYGVSKKDKRSSKTGESTQTQETTVVRVYPDSPTNVVSSLPELSQTVVGESGETHVNVPPLQPPIEEPARQKNLDIREEDGRGRRPAPPPTSFPSMPIPDDPVSTQCIALATERWGANNGDTVIGDLLRTFPPAVVRYAMDREFDKHGPRLTPAYLRSICQDVNTNGIPKKPGEDHGKTATQFRPEETRSKIQRPDLPRTPEFADVHRMWDNLEKGIKA